MVSPASYPSRAWLAESVRILARWALRAEVGEHATDEWGYLAGRDADRTGDVNDASDAGLPGTRPAVEDDDPAGRFAVHHPLRSGSTGGVCANARVICRAG